MKLKFFLPYFLLFFAVIQSVKGITLVNDSFYTEYINLVNDSSKKDSSKKPCTKNCDFNEVIKKFRGLIEKKKEVQAVVKRAQAIQKDSSFHSAYISDFKKYKKIADSLSVDLISEWDSVHNIQDVDYYSVSDTVNKIVFGFHPYWMGSSHESYDFDLLTDIAFFSFELEPRTGKFTTTNKWDDNTVLDSAQKHGCKMHITISNFTQSNNKKFLKNKEARDTNIIELVKTVNKEGEGLDGVVIDFENVPNEVRNELTQYVKDLSIALKEHGKVLSITIPAIDSYNAFDINAMEGYIEYFLLMGYDYYGSWSAEAGPVAPFDSQSMWGSYSVDASVSDYLKMGMESTQLVLVVPYYGASWTVKNTELPSSRKKFLKSVTYREVKNSYKGVNVTLEPTSKSAFFNNVVGSDTNQIWFDNVAALSHKYDYVISKNLAGIGIWALGYDNGHTDLWELIEQKFGNVEIAADSVDLASEETSDIDLSTIFEREITLRGMYDFFETDALVKDILKTFSLILFLAFLLSLRRKEMRNIVLRKSLITLFLLLILPLAICLYVIFTTSYTVSGLTMLFGILIGYGIYFMKEQSQFTSKKRIP